MRKLRNKILLMSCIVALGISAVGCGNTKSNNTEPTEATTAVTTATEATTETDTEATKGEAAELIEKVAKKFSESNNYKMTMNIDTDVDITITEDGEEIEPSGVIRSDIDVEYSSADIGTYCKIFSITGDDDESIDSIVENNETYYVDESRMNYYSIDAGQNWYKGEKSVDEMSYGDLFTALFGDTEAFNNATVEEKEDNYIITVDMSDIKDFAEQMSGGLAGANAIGSAKLTINSDYLPVSMDISDIDFDTTTMEEALEATYATGANTEAEGSEEEPVDLEASEESNIDVSADMNFTAKIEFGSWDKISDSDVTPSKEIIDAAKDVAEDE